jgi:acyl-CoA synthetase (AMP-forming)/AMP-acid ligase II
LERAARDHPEAGLLYFHDRLKDVIRVRGENVSSAQIEAVFLADRRITECAAVARSAGHGDDDVHLYVVLAPDAQLRPEEIIALGAGRCRTSAARLKSQGGSAGGDPVDRPGLWRNNP